MNSEVPEGATPIDPDDARALIPSHIATRAELNEWEHDNIVEGERWAGRWRTTEKNIGIAPEGIPQSVQQLLVDVTAQLEAHSYPIREIAARFHHRLVQIHPFPNGNGRVARTYADLLLVSQGEERFRWGHGDLISAGDVREKYIAALRAADGRDYGPLLRFLDVS